jgi:hypothetical protein
MFILKDIMSPLCIPVVLLADFKRESTGGSGVGVAVAVGVNVRVNVAEPAGGVTVADGQILCKTTVETIPGKAR